MAQQLMRALCQIALTFLLPSVNASSRETAHMGRRIARHLGMTEAQYRKTLAELRRKIRIIENNLREKDYSFDYSRQRSKALFKYRKAFARNDRERYLRFLSQVQNGMAAMHTGTLMPYEIITPCFDRWYANRKLSETERRTMDVTWNSQAKYLYSIKERNGLFVSIGHLLYLFQPEIIHAAPAAAVD